MAKEKKIIITAGGTGGHLFPAQSLAGKILSEKPGTQVLFLGGKLSQNRFFNQQQFLFEDIPTAHLNGINPLKLASSGCEIIKGIKKSLKLIKRFSPDLLIGFGSYYTFPVLAAASLKKIPFVLHEQNAIPGKVNRLFSSKALWTAVTFPGTEQFLKGNAMQVNFPLKRYSDERTKEEAFNYFGLNPQIKTLLVFGGSQGANFINDLMLNAVGNLKFPVDLFQVIHFIGNKKSVSQYMNAYQQSGISCCVKEFENRMDLAWTAADFAVTRAGASSIAELLHFEVPSLLIPFPYAADDHQSYNGEFIANHVGGGLMKKEHELSPENFITLLKEVFRDEYLLNMQRKIVEYKNNQKQQSFETLIFKWMHQD